MTLTDEVNRSLALCRKQGGFAPCPPGEACQNCGCPLSGHWKTNETGYATACNSCRCQIWCCRHGGQRVTVPAIT